MKSPFWRTGIALALLAGLGAWAYFGVSKRPATTERDAAKPKEKAFQQLERTKVTELTLSSPEQTIRLARENGAWKMKAPMEVVAAANEVDTLLSTLETLEIDSVAVESAPDLSEFGLATPKLVVSVKVEGASEPKRLALGDDVPGQSLLFAKSPSEARILTLPSYVRASLEKKPFDLRDRDLLHVKRDEIKALRIEGPAGAYSLARQGKDEWGFTSPLVTRAGRWSVDSLLGTIENLRMESVASESAADLKPFGLVKPTYSVALDLGEGRAKTLALGSKTSDDKYYAREAGGTLVGVIAKALADDLAKGMSELRAKRLLDVSAYEVDGFDVEADGTKKVYTRSSTKDKEGLDVYKWKRTTPDGKDLVTNTVQDSLFKIGAVEVAEFMDQPAEPGRYGLDKPVLKATLRQGAEKGVLWFELGQKDGAFYARRPDDKSILKLDKDKGEDLVKAFKGL
jgi:hypothetical protein